MRHVPAASAAAFLRVYEPLAAFPTAERPAWQRYVQAGRAPSRAVGARAERAATLAATVRPTLSVPLEHAFTVTVDGLVYLCPWRLQLRIWESAADFRAGLPGLLADVFVPPPLAEAAAAALIADRARRPDLVPHLRMALWGVPLPWFVLFEAGERLLVTGRGERSLTYSTPMSKARRRAARGLAVLRRAAPGDGAIDGLEDLGRWLEEFHPHSRVELDYGDLVEHLDDTALRADSSVADLADGLQALAEGRAEEALAAYARVRERWRPMQLMEHLN
jgi:hypothetical protein